MNKYVDQLLKGLLTGTSLPIGLLLGVATIKAFDWSGISSVDTTTSLTANLWNTTMSTITGSIQTLEDTMVSISGDQTIAGTKSFSSPIVGQVPTATDHLSTKAYVDGVVSAAGESNITFSTCSTTDISQIYYECNRANSACSTVGAYCGGGKVAGTISGSIIVSALSDEGRFMYAYTTYYYPLFHALSSCENKETFGFNGRSLPNINELLLLYNNKNIIGNFESNTNTEYWSSTDNGSSNYYISFNNGTTTSQSHGNLASVRCIRKY
ncbi:MAG: hypothetical protein PHN31_05140 [Candidatus Gracilibacteria bacterium]|nr:hypothetical protein [Candidatus Gracilibacteria bacterium]